MLDWKPDMFDHSEIPELKEKVRAATQGDKRVLEKLCDDMRGLKPLVRTIQPRSATAVSLVASDGGNNKIQFDPFLLQIVRVVDSYGKRLCLDVVSPTTDTDLLSARQFNDDGSPRTALGRLMRDLNKTKLCDLSGAIPSGERVRREPAEVKTGWVLTYRDLCEWATLYERICYQSFPTDTLLVRDGLLRSKFFSGHLFMEMAKNLSERIEEIRRTERRQIFLVGVAKHSQVLDRYRLAIGLENLFSAGEPRYVAISRDIEKQVYQWEEYARGMEAIGTSGEQPRFVAGSMYLVRFGLRKGDPIWPIDIFDPQRERDQEIFGYLLHDAISGFPIPHYPRCLQRAHEWAEVADFDAELLQDEVFEAVRELLPENQRELLDTHQLGNVDLTGRRYG
jgi:hypothetical protein